MRVIKIDGKEQNEINMIFMGFMSILGFNWSQDKINVQCDDLLFPFLLLFCVGNYVKKSKISFIFNITFIEIIAKTKMGSREDSINKIMSHFSHYIS